MKQFLKNDKSFICSNCNKEVLPLGYTSRDHCPYCLYSMHVDINPGDRMETCMGLLIPYDIERFKNTYKILYKCKKCNILKKNIIANDDDFEKIIELMNKK